MKSRKTIWRGIVSWLVALASGIAILGIAAFTFIKVNASGAALIADNVLRPIFGTQRVIAIESFLFNASDKVSQVEYKYKSAVAPQFLVTTTSQPVDSSVLNLSPIPSNFAHPLTDEGVWKDLSTNVSPDNEVMAYTFVRPDPTRTFAEVSLVQIDTSQLQLGTTAGTVEPGSTLGHPGSGKIPQAVIDGGKLAAAFDGGFLYVDGKYGMIVDGVTYAPLKNDTGTVVGYTDGTVKIINYNGEDLGSNVAFVRQNGPLLITDGTISLDSSDTAVAKGRVLHGGMYTWRSGIGVTSSGALLYAGGNDLSPETLAIALKMVGAVNAMELDINASQVRFDLFNKDGKGGYISTPLNQALAYLSDKNQYLKGYTRDFFYIYKK